MSQAKSWFESKSAQEKSYLRFAWKMFGQNSFFKIKLLHLLTMLQIKSFAVLSWFKSKKCLNKNMFGLKSKILEKSSCFSPESLASNRFFFFFFGESLAILVQYLWTKAFLVIQNVWIKVMSCLLFKTFQERCCF